MSRPQRWLLHLLVVLLVGLASPGEAAAQTPIDQRPVVDDVEGVLSIIADRAEARGVSGRWMVALARCESHLNVYAVGRAGELGLYQLHPRGLLPVFYVWGYTDPWSAWEQADFTAVALSRGLSGHWSCA